MKSRRPFLSQSSSSSSASSFTPSPEPFQQFPVFFSYGSSSSSSSSLASLQPLSPSPFYPNYSVLSGKDLGLASNPIFSPEEFQAQMTAAELPAQEESSELHLPQTNSYKPDKRNPKPKKPKPYEIKRSDEVTGPKKTDKQTIRDLQKQLLERTLSEDRLATRVVEVERELEETKRIDSEKLRNAQAQNYAMRKKLKELEGGKQNKELEGQQINSDLGLSLHHLQQKLKKLNNDFIKLKTDNENLKSNYLNLQSEYDYLNEKLNANPNARKQLTCIADLKAQLKEKQEELEYNLQALSSLKNNLLKLQNYLFPLDPNLIAICDYFGIPIVATEAVAQIALKKQLEVLQALNQQLQLPAQTPGPGQSPLSLTSLGLFSPSSSSSTLPEPPRAAPG